MRNFQDVEVFASWDNFQGIENFFINLNISIGMTHTWRFQLEFFPFLIKIFDEISHQHEIGLE
jgi:hypothetical protein